MPSRLNRWIAAGLEEWIKATAPEAALLLLRRKLRNHPELMSALTSYSDAVRNADLVVVTGMGGITDAFPVYASDLLKSLQFAERLGTKFILVGQGIGPLTTGPVGQLAARILPRAEMIALREDFMSRLVLAELGVDESRIVTTGDDAIEVAFKQRPDRLGDMLGINLRASDYSEVDDGLVSRIRAVLAQVVDDLDVRPVPVPISSVAGEEDLLTIERLFAGPGRALAAIGEHRTPDQVIKIVIQCRVLVTGSYHAAVFACAIGVPTVCIARSAYYEGKFRGLSSLFGPGCTFVLANHVDFEQRLDAAVRSLWGAAESTRRSLLERAETQITSGHEAYERIRTDILR